MGVSDRVEAALAQLLGSGGHDVARDLDRDVDLVITGRAEDDAELQRALALEVPLARPSRVLREHFLVDRRPVVAFDEAAAMCAWILDQAGLAPGFFLGERSDNLGAASRAASARRRIVLGERPIAAKTPFVVDGAALDSAGLLDCVGLSNDDVVVLGASIDEDITRELLARIPDGGLVACDVRAHTSHEAQTRARTTFYALDGDETGDITPTWLGLLAPPDPETNAQPFDLFIGGSSCGRFVVRGRRSVRGALGALVATMEGFGVALETARRALASFSATR